ncbi:MAG TPA: selenoneine biosynthesis selenosugar synthase SenB [Usitatibacter sp.]|nr:selenoneine biosynthesis selenosugar synthase SenB [Usitatibacter sp.]
MVSRAKPVVCIVTPATSSSNNGNWRTAARWSQMLRDRYRVIVQTDWDGAPVDALIALHARRSAGSIADYRERHPDGPLAVVLTGTDLYRDLPQSVEAQRSLDLADRIVVLQDDALRILGRKWRRKATVVFQSAPSLDAPRRKPEGRLDCVVVGHLRPEKSPQTVWEAVALLPPDLPIRIRHIGAALEPGLGDRARECERADDRYRYVGALPHGRTRAAMRAAHVLIHPSVMEGGANVIVEAIMAGTPVIASRMSGNVGMLGRVYDGYFKVGDARALARLLEKAAEDRRFLRSLEQACRKRRALFRPQAEQAAVRRLVADLLKARR